MAHMPAVDMPDGGTAVTTTRTLTAGTGLAGGGDLSADRSFALANTAVSPGTYTNANITVDQQGRLTFAEDGDGQAVVTDGTTITGDGTPGDPLTVPVPITGLPVLNVKEAPYSATGDGTTDDSTAIRAAIAAALAAGGAIVYFPKGTYIVSKDPAGTWCLDITGSNITLMGIKGASVIKAAAGMAGTSTAIIRVNEKRNFSMIGMTVDGNWGNSLTYVWHTSDGLTLPQATINVEDTTGAADGAAFPSSGTFVVETTAGLETITYTGKTATSFTGCTGGTGKLVGLQYNANGPLARGKPVGRQNGIGGINHSDQADPKNYGVFLRGTENVTIDNCLFRQLYGDAIWCGQGATNFFTSWTKNVNIVRTAIDMCARDGVVFGQKCEGIRLHHCEISNTYAEAVDTEPVGAGMSVRNVTIDSCAIGVWWGKMDPARSNNIAISITSSYSLASGPASAARNFRVTNNRIEGGVYITNSMDVVVERNKITCDWDGNGYSPVVILGACNDISVVDNRLYGRVAGWAGVISVVYFASGSAVPSPKNVRIQGNRIHARDGIHGISVDGQGGNEFGGGEVGGETNVATGIASTVVTRAGAGWTVNQWVSYQVTMGGAYGTIVSNTATTFTIDDWTTPEGEAVAEPAAGSYTIFSGGGVLDIFDNTVDCTNDGNGQGGRGITIAANRSAGRVRVQRNTVVNALTSAIYVDTRFRNVRLIDVRHNHARTNETTNTATHVVFDTPSNITKLLFADNTQEGSIAASSGLSSGTWLEEDGAIQRWAGYGSPETVVTAAIGSQYRRLDGGAGTCLYVKESGALAVGWVAK
jgi:polygalacturonase